jgi:hypothetical protein
MIFSSDVYLQFDKERFPRFRSKINQFLANLKF